MSRRPITWRGALIPAAILVLTALATIAAVNRAHDQARNREAAAVAPATRALASELTAARAALDDLRALFASGDRVGEAAFDRLAAAALLREPALVALAWRPRTGAGYARRAGPVLSGDVAALTAPQTSDAMDRARDAGAPRMTVPIGTPDANARVVMVSPVYAQGSTPPTVAGRRRELRGFVVAVIRLSALAPEARAALPAGAGLEVRDGSATVIGRGAATGATTGVVEIAGRRWTVGVSGLGGASPVLPIAVALGGLTLAGIVFLLFSEAARREREAADRIAEQADQTRRARGALERLQARHDLILASAGEGIIGVDLEGRATFVNPAAAQTLGWSVEELTGEHVDRLVMPTLSASLQRGRVESGETVFRRRDGTTFPGEHTTTPLVEDDELIGVVIAFRDVTARKRLEARTAENLAAAEERAAVDPLTGLANHRTFHERLRTEVERAHRRGGRLSLVLMDIDHFKRVNDVYGHQAGDRVLQELAGVLSSQARAGELVARVGGEEFAMILPDADEGEAYRAAERLRAAVADSEFPIDRTVTLSAGVCELARATDAGGLYRSADGALYWAKNHGRNQVTCFVDDIAEALSAEDEAARTERSQAMISIRLLARVVDGKNAGTSRHSERVADLSARIARRLGWREERIARLHQAALVHDVGKIGVPDAVLFSPKRLTREEYEAVKEHAEVGARIVSEALDREQTSWVRGHHERWDGDGYPDGLRGDEIPEGARIIAVAEAWDAITSDRPDQRAPGSPEKALGEIRSGSGSQFWPPAAEALERIQEPA